MPKLNSCGETWATSASSVFVRTPHTLTQKFVVILWRGHFGKQCRCLSVSVGSERHDVLQFSAQLVLVMHVSMLVFSQSTPPPNPPTPPSSSLYDRKKTRVGNED
jgi:hypothetical protein